MEFCHYYTKSEALSISVFEVSDKTLTNPYKNNITELKSKEFRYPE